MKRYEAIEVITRELNGNELVISANGKISRELFTIKESPLNFYMLGSMGLASSIGFGLAYNLPNRKIVVIDGDGNILMNLGSLATIGHFAPKNLVHFVLDNEMHASTGGQPTVSNTVRLEEVALAAGYRTAKKVSSSEDLRIAVKEVLNTTEGPSFVLIKIEKGEKEVPRVSHEPTHIKSRFKEAIANREI
jgi:phosphonopyruvate decarboxylase/sulfopyruvate decarboxylase subunit beta